MAKENKLLGLNEVRRRDRAIEDEELIRSLLHTAPVGNLATVCEGQPYINSNLFVYDQQENSIYMHTAKIGRTRTNLEMDEKVCFNVQLMGRLLPAATALEFSVEYSSVVIFGSGKIITDREKAIKALQMLLDKYAPHLRPGQHYRATTFEELSRTSVYQISIEKWSGKCKKAAADFPGSFFYPTPTI